MNDLAQRNGRDLDGTAIIASVSEIDNLASKGFIKKTLRPLRSAAVCRLPGDQGPAGWRDRT